MVGDKNKSREENASSRPPAKGNRERPRCGWCGYFIKKGRSNCKHCGWWNNTDLPYPESL